MGEGVASYAAHLGSTRRRCRSAWTPRGGPLGGEGLDPSPAAPLLRLHVVGLLRDGMSRRMRLCL